MEQPKYVIKVQGKYLRQAEDFRVMLNEITRRTGKTIGGLFEISEGTGKFRSDVVYILPKDQSGMTVQKTAAGVKSFIRRLRPYEADKLAEIDSEISTLRAERKEVMRQAWNKGHVVTLKDVLGRIK